MIESILKWVGVFCFSLSTIIMLNPNVAATSVTPWALFIAGNSIWLFSSWKKDWALFCLCLFYLSWDMMLAISRFNPHLFDSVQYIIKLMEVFP